LVPIGLALIGLEDMSSVDSLETGFPIT
jgi:hypothetical protein